MTILITEINELPNDYYPVSGKSPKARSVDHNGREYRFIGRYEKSYSFPNRVWLVVSALVKFILRLPNSSDNWNAGISGKTRVKVYCAGPTTNHSFTDTHNPKRSSRGKVDAFNPFNNQKHSYAFVSLSDLRLEIAALKKGSPVEQKKAALIQQGLDLFISKECPIELETFRLENRDNFKFSSTSADPLPIDPSYFSERFRAERTLNLSVTSAFYDYVPTDSVSEDFWVDFANASLGGGCFTHGFVQEEIMVHEMPDFAAHIAGHLSSSKTGWCDITTREGSLTDRNRVMRGSPNPYLMKGLHRVQAVNNDLAYGDKLSGLSESELLDSTMTLAHPQNVNILAIAAPKLFSRNRAEQWDPSTLKDNFNTLMAGLQLIKEQSDHPIIHSGKIGCGAFSNDTHAIYLLHCLAAQHTGLTIKLHGYQDQEALQFQQSWNSVAPQLTDKPLKECIEIISQHLATHYA